MDSIDKIRDRVLDAVNRGQSLCIEGGGTKAFYGRQVTGEPLGVADYEGVIAYQPSELVITARAGTKITDLNNLLAENRQKLGFDPPVFGPESTLGGVIAAGLAGPSRPWCGGVQDYVLGVRMLSGRGEVLSFGGQVIKNVAGFDVSRLMVGAMGCLGVLLEISLKVVPIPETERTLSIPQARIEDAVSTFNQLSGRPLPVTAAAWHQHVSRIRLSGSEKGVQAAADSIRREYPDLEFGSDKESFWSELRDLTHPFFDNNKPLYRASVLPSTGVLYSDNLCMVDWGGALRWYCLEEDSYALLEAVGAAGGHVSVFRNGNRSGEVMAAVSPGIMKLQEKLKAMFDPDEIFNPGRMYETL